MIRIVYFAWVREGVGVDGEEYALAAPASVAAVLNALAERGGRYAVALGPRERLRFAVDGVIVAADAEVRPGQELAVFPPVTGG